MQQVLIWIIFAISGIFLVLTTLIIVNKAWRETQEATIARRRKELEPKILSWVHGDEKTVRKAFGENFSTSDTGVIEQILLDHVQRVRGIERDRLAQAMDQLGLVDGYLDGLNSRRWWRRAESAEKLGLSTTKRAIQPLSRALDDEIHEVRLRAAKALGMLGDAASALKLVRALNEPSRWSTIRVADILIGMGHKSVDAVIEAFPGLTREGQLAVLDIVGRVRLVSVTPWLVEKTKDESTDIRARAFHALGSIGDPSVTPELQAALNDKEWPVRAMAAKALGRMRITEAIPQLAKALRDEQWWVRHNAGRALRAMGPLGLYALERLVADGDVFAREQAILMLEEAGRVDERAAELVHEGPDERRVAKSLLEKIVASGTTGRLRVLSREHPVADVRRELSALLPEEVAS